MAGARASARADRGGGQDARPAPDGVSTLCEITRDLARCGHAPRGAGTLRRRCSRTRGCLAHGPQHRSAAGLRDAPPATGGHPHRRAPAGHRRFRRRALKRRSGCRALRRAGRRAARSVRGGGWAEGAGQRRCGHLRRKPQHQLHQHLRIPLQLLRVLQGYAQTRGRRTRVSLGHPRDRRPNARGGRARRHRGVPAGRHSPELHGRHVSRDIARAQEGGSGHARACFLAARGLAWRRDARHAAARLSVAAQMRRPREPSGHGRGNPRRWGARHTLSRQAPGSGSK